MTKARGFSLIEMLVAMVILSLSLGVLYQAAMGATRNVRVAAEYNEALMIAESVLSELSAVTEVDVAQEGVFGEYRWQAQTTAVSSEDAEAAQMALPLAEVTVVVYWGESRRERQFALSSIFPVLPPTAVP
jgi:general secretion pathway protein I